MKFFSTKVEGSEFIPRVPIYGHQTAALREHFRQTWSFLNDADTVDVADLKQTDNKSDFITTTR